LTDEKYFLKYPSASDQIPVVAFDIPTQEIPSEKTKTTAFTSTENLHNNVNKVASNSLPSSGGLFGKALTNLCGGSAKTRI
jgi:hypothetical protein